MADNTRMKELSADVKHNAETIQNVQAQMSRLEFTNKSLLDRLEGMQQSNDSKFNFISSTLDSLIQNKMILTSPHGVASSQKSPFLVRNIKLKFPRFDGKNVLDWIFHAEQFFDYYGTVDARDWPLPQFIGMSKGEILGLLIARDWPLARALEHDYGPSIYECPRAPLFKLT